MLVCRVSALRGGRGTPPIGTRPCQAVRSPPAERPKASGRSARGLCPEAGGRVLPLLAARRTAAPV